MFEQMKELETSRSEHDAVVSGLHSELMRTQRLIEELSAQQSMSGLADEHANHRESTPGDDADDAVTDMMGVLSDETADQFSTPVSSPVRGYISVTALSPRPVDTPQHLKEAFSSLNQLTASYKMMARQEDLIAEMSLAATALESKLNAAELEIATKTDSIAQLSTIAKNLHDKLSEKEAEASEHTGSIVTLTSTVSTLEHQLQELQSEVIRKDTKISELSLFVISLQQKVLDVKADLAGKDRTVAELSLLANTLTAKLSALESEHRVDGDDDGKNDDADADEGE